MGLFKDRCPQSEENMLRLVASSVAMAVLASVAIAPQTAVGQTVMKIAHFLPPGEPRDLGARRAGELIEADDRCDLEVQVYPSSQLGSFEDINEGVMMGSIELSLLPASYIVGTDALFGVFDFPFFWPTSAEAIIAVYDSDAMDPLKESIQDHNMVLLDVWHTGFKNWTAHKALDTLEAFQGLTARVMPSQILVEQGRALGVQPVTMPFSETYTALQTGAIDTQENPNTVNWNMKFHEVQSHITMSNHGQLDQTLLVNKPWFDALPADCQTAIGEALREGRQVTLDETRKQEEQALEAFQEAGIEIVEVSDAEWNRMKDAVLPPVRDYYLNQTGDEGQELLGRLEEAISAASQR
jgi:tripartite ATP-independent transporter DctP family solute receptor